MIAARVRGRLLGIANLVVRSTFCRTLAVLTCIGLIIGLWAFRRQLVVAMVRSDDFMVWGLLSGLLLLGLIVFVSVFRALVAATVVAGVVAAGEKLAARRAEKLARKTREDPLSRRSGSE